MNNPIERLKQFLDNSRGLGVWVGIVPRIRLPQDEMKQMLLMRTDLKMRRGKEIAQACHASLAITLENINHPYVQKWLAGRFKKIAVGVDSLEELTSIVEKAKALNIPTRIIVDSGLTEFNNVATTTCAAIGPAPDKELDELTGHLKLR